MSQRKSLRFPFVRSNDSLINRYSLQILCRFLIDQKRRAKKAFELRRNNSSVLHNLLLCYCGFERLSLIRAFPLFFNQTAEIYRKKSAPYSDVLSGRGIVSVGSIHDVHVVETNSESSEVCHCSRLSLSETPGSPSSEITPTGSPSINLTCYSFYCNMFLLQTLTRIYSFSNTTAPSLILRFPRTSILLRATSF